MQLTTPNTFSPGTRIVASQMNANFTTIRTWANGNIQQDNFGTFSGKVSWDISSSVGAIDINNTSGVLAAETSAVRVRTAAAQTLGDALLFLDMAHASSTIPVLALNNVGTGASAVFKDNSVDVLRVRADGEIEKYQDSNWGRSVVVSKSAAYTARDVDDTILADTGTAWTLTLQDPTTSRGKRLTVQKTSDDFNALTIEHSGSSFSTTLNTEGEAVELISNGTTWRVLRRDIPETWADYTPTTSWLSNATPTGKWRRVGDSILIDGAVSASGAVTAATLTFDLPSGLTIDTDKLANFTSAKQLGQMDFRDSSASLVYPGHVAYSSTSALVFVYYDDAAGGIIVQSSVSNASPVSVASGDLLTFRTIAIPIEGWNG